MSFSFEKQPAYAHTLDLIRLVDEKLQYTKRHRDRRIPEMERFLTTLQDAAASIARTGTGDARHALAAHEQILAACPALARLLQMDIVSSSEHDDFMRHLAAIAGELQLLIASCGG